MERWRDGEGRSDQFVPTKDVAQLRGHAQTRDNMRKANRLKGVHKSQARRQGRDCSTDLAWFYSLGNDRFCPFSDTTLRFRTMRRLCLSLPSQLSTMFLYTYGSAEDGISVALL